MAASMRKMSGLRSFLRIIRNRYGCIGYVPSASFCAAPENYEKSSNINISDLLHKSDANITVQDTSKHRSRKSFATMFRESTFVQVGDVREKCVNGRIFDVINDDLYIDFGGKFYCVCPKPSFNPELYVRRQRVMVMLHQFEMSSSFLGTPEHVTLLEADGTLLGIFTVQKTDVSSKSEPQHGDISDLKDVLSSEIQANVDDTNTNTNMNDEDKFTELSGKTDLTSEQSEDLKETEK